MKYKVKNTDILHNGEKVKEGEVVELTENEAKSLLDYLEPIQDFQEETKKKNGKKSEAQKPDNSQPEKTEPEKLENPENPEKKEDNQ